MTKEQLFNTNPEQFMLKCGICGKEFLPTSYKQYANLTKKAKKYGRMFYCSDECRLLAKGTKKCNCDNCGKICYVPKYDYEHRKHHFCSKQCWLEYKKGHKTTNYGQKTICQYCGKEYDIQKASFGKYCSLECQHNDVIDKIASKIENGEIVSHRKLRNYLLRRHSRCMNPNCKWDWDDSKEENPTLQLHHIDGNHHNNTLSNCILLCPSCHSLTDNYGYKHCHKSTRINRKKKNY